MNLIDDFSILIWGEKPTKQIQDNANVLMGLLFEKADDKDLFSQASSIILSTNSQNYEKFCELETFREIISFLTDNSKEDINFIKSLQIALLNTLVKLGENYKEQICSFIKQLRKENIIRDETEKKVLSLLDLVKKPEISSVKPIKKREASKNYKEHIEFFKLTIKELTSICESETFKSQLANLDEKLNNQTFSIGITGVMNAGKSTMLNALLGKEILGTSVVPETANLTIIKHSKKPFAKVNFWKKDEWERIEKSADFLPSIKSFIDQTNETFGEKISTYITNDGKSDEIKTEDLSKYTSAKHSGLICNLVKSVELHEDLDFVKDGVTIVDTPGLDDPVVQREEITKDYLNVCDVMIHLMNVNQSATEKDVEFIIDSLTYGHISRLLIVITRIDTVTQEELNEVIAYTKKSIKSTLIQNNQEAKFDSIISKIDFLPIAGKLALMHRIGKENEALKEGFSLEKTGILDIERYLQNVLFGQDNEKNKLLLQSVNKEFDLIISKLKEAFLFEKNSLNKSSDELQIEFDKTKEENKQNLKVIEKLENQIKEAKQSLEEYFKTLHNFIEGKLSSLKIVAIQRLSDDVSYEWRKNKQKPNQNRIKTMTEFCMKDGIIDMIRDYRYEFQKRMESEIEQIAQISSSLFTTPLNSNFDAKAYFEENFGGSFLSGSYAITNERVLNALKKVKKDNIETFSVQLDEIFTDTIQNLSSTLMPTLQKININLLDGFIEISNKPANELKSQMKEKEDFFTKHIKLLQENKTQAKARLEEIENKLTSLQVIQNNIEGNKI